MTVNDPWPHLPLSSLPSFFPFPPHGTTVAASSFICQYNFHSLLLFLFNASRTISTNNDFLLDTLSSFLSFFLSSIHPAWCHSQLTLTQHSAAGLRNSYLIVNLTTTLIHYMVQCLPLLSHTTRTLPVTNSCLLSFGSIATQFSIANIIYKDRRNHASFFSTISPGGFCP